MITFRALRSLLRYKKNTVTELVCKDDLKLKRKKKIEDWTAPKCCWVWFYVIFSSTITITLCSLHKVCPPLNAICIAYTDHRLFTPSKEMLFCHVTYNYLYHVNTLRNDHNGDLFRVCIDLFVNWKCSLWICLLAIFTEVTHEEFLAK